MVQKITLRADGVAQFGNRMRAPAVQGAAKDRPSIKLSRLHQLLRTQQPRICIVRGEGIGDVITTTPTIAAIKTMFERAEITYATNTRYLGGALVKTLKYNPNIDHIIERDLMDDLTFDLTINLHCPAQRFEKPRARPPSRIDIFANHAGVQLIDPVPKFYIQKEEIEVGELLIRSVTSREKLIMVQPFSSSPARTAVHSRVKQAIIELYQKHGVRSVIITHSSDANSDVLWDNVPGSIFLRDVDIRGIAGVMVHCDLVLCPDSSILHLAGALGVPTVALFGPSPPDSRINHYKNAVGIWEGEDIPACPCFYEMCPTGYSCWDRITTSSIVEKCIEHLNNTKKIDIIKLLDSIKPIQIQTEVI